MRKKRCTFERTDVAHLIRELCSLAIENQFYFWIERVSTEENKLADALSRFEESTVQQAITEEAWRSYSLTVHLPIDRIIDFVRILPK